MLGAYFALIEIFVNYYDALAAFSMFDLTIFFSIPVSWLTADSCHANVTKHRSDFSIVGTCRCITFPPCILFITITIIILCNTF